MAFGEVIEGALEVAERLEALGLATFCKTTGGKGLHVVTPLTVGSQELDWATAKTFAQEICRRHGRRRSPTATCVNMAKKERGGRIFLDYLRNDRTSTAVAPLSPRARPGATVSMPLTWPQVKAGLDPKKYTVRTAPALLKKTKPWADYAKAARAAARGHRTPDQIQIVRSRHGQSQEQEHAHEKGRCGRPGRAISGSRW